VQALQFQCFAALLEAVEQRLRAAEESMALGQFLALCRLELCRAEQVQPG
jgi:hypothetical protein